MIMLRLNYFTQEPPYDHYLNIMIMKLQSFIALLLLIGLTSSQWISEQQPQTTDLTIQIQPPVVIIEDPILVVEPMQFYDQKQQPQIQIIEVQPEQGEQYEGIIIPQRPMNPFDERYRNQDKSKKHREENMSPRQHRRRGDKKKMRPVDYRRDEEYVRDNEEYEEDEMMFPMSKLCMTFIGLAGAFLLAKVCMKKRRACRRACERRVQMPQVVNQNPIYFVDQQQQPSIDEAISFHENELKRLKKPQQNNHQRIHTFEQEY